MSNEWDDLVICRCEAVTLGQIRRAVADGCRSPQEIKAHTRAGMGICQGRTCRPVVADLAVTMAGGRLEGAVPFSTRPPVRPVALEDLARGHKGERQHHHGF